MSGISVSPALVRFEVSSQSSAFKINYTNNSDQALNIRLTAKDFSTLEDGWRLSYLDDQTAETYRYSLSSWLSFTPSNFTLLPKSSREINVAVLSSDLVPGTHYASIIAHFSQPQEATESAITIQGQLVSLAFVRTTTGQERSEAKINSFSVLNNSWFKLPAKYLLRFDNSGNTALTPHGLVVIRDYRGKEIARGILNQDQTITLPETIRKYEIPISIIQPGFHLPGPYQAVLTVTYAPNQTITATTHHFFLFGLTPLLTLIVIAIILKLLFRKKNLYKRPITNH